MYLKGSEYNWLYEFLLIFNEGNLQLFEEALERYKGQLAHSVGEYLKDIELMS